jgi:hypothetical protein
MYLLKMNLSDTRARAYAPPPFDPSPVYETPASARLIRSTTKGVIFARRGCVLRRLASGPGIPGPDEHESRGK